METQNRQIRIRAFGEPAEVAKLHACSPPRPGPGQVLVRTGCAPINPADINVLQGRYGSLPELPAVIGNEGAGIIVEMGEQAADSGLTSGDQVIYLGRSDCWQDFVIAEEDEILKVPTDLAPDAACMLKVNPATAWLLLHHFGTPPEGGWVAQNAANSGVGRAVIALARASGWRTVNLVRRAELIDPLGEAGGDVVVLDNDEGRQAALDAVGGEGIRLALNAVGGESALRLMSLLADGGCHITYGAMGKQPLKIPNSFLIFRGINVRGLWLTQCFREMPREAIEKMYGELAELMTSGCLVQPVDSTFPPDEIRAALGRAQEGGRSGKVLLDFRDGPGQ